MRKGILFAVVCVFALCMAICASAITPDADGYVYDISGDVNGDGALTLRDVFGILRGVISGNITDTDAADANQDGKVTAMDAAKVMQVLTGQAEANKTPIREYYPLSYLENFSEDTVTISATATSTATVNYTARYVDNGVEITAVVKDPILFTKPGDIGNGDNVSMHLQGTNSIMRGDRFAIHFCCDADGTYMLRNYSNASKGFAKISGIDPTKVNDKAYFTYNKTSDGYKVTFFASYDLLRIPKEQAYGKVRLLLSLRNTDSASATSYLVYGTDTGVNYDMPNTWLVLDKNNKFTRDDFDTVSFKEDILPANKFASLDFLNDLATVSAGSGCTLREATAGAQVFSDRTYCFEESYLPAELVGTTYVSGPIGGNTATVTKAGYVVLAVGELSNYDTLNAKVKAAGWTQILYAAGTPYNFAVRTDIPDLVNWYVKYCKAGETINFGKWAVPFAKGATVPFAWESKPASLILDTSDSYYSISTRKWHGCPTIEATNGGRLIAAWSTGDKAEGEPGNYDVLAYSDDNGKTWKEFGYVNSEKSGDPNKQTTICDIQLWLDRETNTLYIFYIASSTLSKFEKSSAVWMISVENPDDDFAKWKVSEARYLFPGLLRNNITVLSDGTWLAMPNNYLDERYTTVYASTDKGQTWSLRGKAYIPEGLSYDETMVTELEDGTLWMLIRANTSKKVSYQAFSFDKGYTWTMSSPSDIFNCATRFNITRLSSGALLLVYNAESGRKMMTAALSYDDGKTWPYSITLYTSYTTYPDVSVLNVNGVDQIHIVFDRDRYNYGRVYHGVFTEEYIQKNSGITVDRDTMLHMVTTLK